MKALRTVVTVAILVAVGVSLAQAQQTMQPRPRRATERALFGGGTGSVDQSLTANSNVGWTYYDALRVNQFPAEQRPLDSMSFGQASAFLTYAFSRPYLQATASAGGFAYYRDSDKEWFRYHSYSTNATGGHTWHPTRKTLLTLTQSVAFQPSYIGTTLAGTIARPSDLVDPSLALPPDVTALQGHTLNANSSVVLSRTLSRRLSLDGAYGFNRNWTFDRPGAYDDAASQTAGAALRSQLTRHLSLRTGYRFTDTLFGPSDQPHVRQHSADIALDYNQGGTIQLTRRTTLALTGAATALADWQRNQHYLVLGSALLNREIGRTWNASVGYNRHVDFSAFFREPLLLDTVTADFGGLIAPRLSFDSMGGYSRGTVGFSNDRNNYDQANAGAVLQFALVRYIALNVSYSYYYRRFGELVIASRDLTNHSQSQSVRVFITAYAPLFHRARRADATR